MLHIPNSAICFGHVSNAIPFRQVVLWRWFHISLVSDILFNATKYDLVSRDNFENLVSYIWNTYTILGGAKNENC